MKDLAERIAEWIAEFVARSGMEGAVVGLSGGVDSAVVAALLEQALGDSALGIIMPCESDPRDAEDARLVAEALGLKTATVDLGPAFAALAGALPEAGDMARANLKPRLRMAALYHFANRLSYLVAGTGNRTEIMLGYFTKFGDGACDFLPLGGLLKGEVRELARKLGLPGVIIDKPPSAGLFADQTDEGELGMSYDEMDRAIEAMDREAVPPGAGDADARDGALPQGGDSGVSNQRLSVPPIVMDRVREFVNKTGHKRSLPPRFEP
jgi:NAD+ synthase